MKKLFITLIICAVSSLWANIFPPNVLPNAKWKSLEAEHFDIIYDERIEDDAKEIANQLDSLYEQLSHSMGGEIDRYTLILPAESIDQRAYVESSNRMDRAEFLPLSVTASQFTNDLYTKFILHEGRHMVQDTHVRNSFLRKALNIIVGGYGYYTSFFIPRYLYEGDAVLTETLLSESGPGRSPSNEMVLRAILLADKKFSFSKALHGSTKDVYPSHYTLGYYLITYLRREFGANVVEKIINDAANNPLPLNLSLATYLNTGKTIPKIYDEVMAELKLEWEKQDSLITPTEYENIITSNNKGFSNSIEPKINSEGELFYIESSLDKSLTLKSYIDGDIKEHIRVLPGYTVSGSNVAYSKRSRDIRWSTKGYSDIYIYNTESRVTRSLTSKQRYFNPALSNDGKKIVVSEFSTKRIPSLVVLDIEDGTILQKITLPRGENITGLTWNEVDSKIAITKVSSKGSALCILDLDSEELTYLTAEDNIEKSSPRFYKNNLVFVTSYSGVYNIHLINIDTKDEFQVVSSRFGAMYPEVFGDELIYSDYSVDGFKLCKIKLDHETWIPKSEVIRGHVDYFAPLQSEELPTPVISNREYPTKNYSPNANLIDIHSWVVNPFTPLFAMENMKSESLFDVMELILFSHDKLGYMDSQLSTHYSIKSSAWDVNLSGKYMAFYPEVGWNFYIYSEGVDTGVSNLSLETDISVPLTSFDLSNYQNIKIGIKPKYYNDLKDNDLSTADLSYYVLFDLKRFSPYNRIYSTDFKIASRISLNQNIVGNGSLTISALSEIILPGVFKTHNLRFQNSVSYDLNSNKTISKAEPTSSIPALIDINTDDSSFVLFNNVEYGIPLFTFDVSILNWLYITKFNISLGYESFYSTEEKYSQIVKSNGEINYQILRTPMKLASSFSFYYDLDNNEFNYNITPIMVKAIF